MIDAKPTFTPPQEMHRDQMRPSVRGYCDNLREQVNGYVRTAGFQAMPDFLNSASNSDLIHVNRLLTTLETTTITGEVPFDRVEYFRALQKIAPEFDQINLMRFHPSNPMENWDDKLVQLLETVKTFPSPTPKALQEDPHFLDESLRYLNLYLPNNFENAGLLLGFITNKYLTDANPEEKAKIIQVIDLEGTGVKINYLGYGLSGGTLTITGETGDHLGLQMTDGKIMASLAGMGVGDSMKGGSIEVSKAGWFIGNEMSGGSIRVGKCDSNVGERMTGGVITILEEAKDSVGVFMKGGHIVADKIGNYGGKGMSGGLLEVQIARMDLGVNMRDGTIKVGRGGISMGRGMLGGTIIADKANDYIAPQMHGGLIQIRNAAGMIGDEMDGGRIEILEEHQDIASKKSRKGGEIYFKGKLIK